MEDYRNEQLEVLLQKVDIHITGYRKLIEEPTRKAIWNFNQNHKQHYQPLFIGMSILIIMLFLAILYFVSPSVIYKVIRLEALDQGDVFNTIIFICVTAICFTLWSILIPSYFRCRRKIIVEEQVASAIRANQKEYVRYLYYLKLLHPIIEELEKINSIKERYCQGGAKKYG